MVNLNLSKTRTIDGHTYYVFKIYNFTNKLLYVMSGF